jgi:hypothetical protein
MTGGMLAAQSGLASLHRRERKSVRNPKDSLANAGDRS